MLPERDREALRDMLAYAEKALEQAQEYERADLNGESRERFSLQYLVAIIGEAATRVSSNTRQEHPEIPWAEMVGMRHHLIHGYNTVDTNILWDTLTVDLPMLVAQLRAILAGSTPPPSDNETPAESADAP